MARAVWNPWKIATVVIAVVVTTALVTGLVVANWNGKETAKPVASASRVPVRQVAPVARTSNNATDVLKDAVIGGAVGAGVGAAGGAIAGGGKGAGKGAAIGGIVGATAGTLYGLHDKQ